MYAYDSNKNVVPEREIVQMALGHELIHALRSMKGNRKSTNLKGTNLMNGADNEYWTQEEFDTVGIDYVRDDGTYADASNWYFTENSLRSEHGYSQRVKSEGERW